MSRVWTEKPSRMSRLVLSLAVGMILFLTVIPSADAAFGFKAFDLTFEDQNSFPVTQAGSHPFAVTNTTSFNSTLDPEYGEIPDESVKDVEVELPQGLVGEPSAVPRCPSIDFIKFNQETKLPKCSDSSAVGYITLKVLLLPGNPEEFPPEYISAPVYNLVPPPGMVQKLGFIALGVPVSIDFTVNPEPPYNIEAHLRDISQVLPILSARLSIWGNPASSSHDTSRGHCIAAGGPSELPGVKVTGETCPTNIALRPFLTLPRSCNGPLVTTYSGDSWQNPGVFTLPASVFSHDSALPPRPQGLGGCGRLGFAPSISARPTTKATQSPSGLDFGLSVRDEGLVNPNGIAQADIKKAVITLPEGMSANPALADGLSTCSQADLHRETLGGEPGVGCPDASKIGIVEVETPLLDEPVNGSLFVATPYKNPFGSLLALYIVIKNPTLGIIIKQPLKVENDPLTGRITTVAENLPELPFSQFRIHFREGTRSPLASPPLCGSYAASAVLTPSSGGSPITTSSVFQIISGPGAGACPSGSSQPFRPGLEAGTLNNAAGRFSPFYLRMDRRDGEQEITHFSIKLPPGVSGKLAGIPFCSDAAIAAAKARTGPQGGEEEIDSPSCPKASEVGRTLAGAGVGPSLAYAPGKIYLAGPYHGSALSLAAITAAKVGPFDLGTVVLRSALKVNPDTAEVFVDATGSDAIPHIIKGIPIHLRDIRVYVDRPDFVLNPTSCARTSTASTVLGSGTNFASEADDVPVTITSPFQAADCATLGFGPKLNLTLTGGTKRGDTPSFRAVVTARKGDANIGKAQVTLPHSEFLEQAHIGTVCTRPQFNAGEKPGAQCPAASVYGYAKAITPLLDESLHGRVYLRPSDHPLPDLVATLSSGKIDIILVGRIDSVRGRIRTTFEAVPDAPVTKFTLTMKGGKRSLLVNSSDLCGSTHRATAVFTGQNGKMHSSKPILKPRGCSRTRKAKSGGHVSETRLGAFSLSTP